MIITQLYRRKCPLCLVYYYSEVKTPYPKICQLCRFFGFTEADIDKKVVVRPTPYRFL
mgnify:CR=1 FL=1